MSKALNTFRDAVAQLRALGVVGHLTFEVESREFAKLRAGEYPLGAQVQYPLQKISFLIDDFTLVPRELTAEERIQRLEGRVAELELVTD